jgi:hypothetical protein
MKRITQSVCFIFFIGLTAFKADNLPQKFVDRLNRAQMSFTQPDGYSAIPTITNDQMHYEYALKYIGKNFEIRYAVTPLDSVFIQYEAMIKAGTKMIYGPNQLYSGALISTAMNLSGDNMPQIKEFPKTAVSTEFNADWGATCVFHVTGSFGDGYNTCMIVAIHKDNLGDAYIFYLTDSPENFRDLLEPAFHALKFK